MWAGGVVVDEIAASTGSGMLGPLAPSLPFMFFR
jgi:hypothetical protein